MALEVIDKEIINKNFKYLDDNDYYDKEELDVDSYLLLLSIKKKCPLATIDKNLMKRALKNGADIITLKNNKIVYIHSKIKAKQI